MQEYSKRLWVCSFFGTLFSFLVITSDLRSMKCLFTFDAFYLGWPAFHYMARNLHMGIIPYWDPHSSCGMPFLAISGLFSPIVLGFVSIFGGSYQSFQYFWILHWLWGIVGFFLLLKRMGFSPKSTGIASLLFGFNGFFIGNAGHTSIIITGCWFPWVIAAMEHGASKRSPVYFVLAGVCLGMSGLYGYPGMVVYACIMLLAWNLLKLKPLQRALVMTGVVIGVGGLVFSPAWIAFITEFKGYTDRAGFLAVEVASNSQKFPFPALCSLVSPGITAGYAGVFNADFSMINGYFGGLGVIALLTVIFCNSLRKKWLWLLVFMLIAFLFSLGSVGGLFVLAYYVFPILRFSRHAALFRFFWMMGGGILAAILAEKLLSSDTEQDRHFGKYLLGVMLVILYTAGCAWLYMVLAPDETIGFVPGSGKNSLGLALWYGGTQIVVFLLYFAVILFKYHYQVTSPFVIGSLIAIILFDSGAHYTINKNTVCGQHTHIAEELSNMSVSGRTELNPSQKRRDISSPPDFNLGLLDNTCYVRTNAPTNSGKYATLVGGYPPHPLHDTKFLSVLLNGPRFWLVPDVAFAAQEDKKALALLTQTDNTSPVPVFLHTQNRSFPDAPRFVVPGQYGTLAVRKYTPENVELTVSVPEDCWLFSTERYAINWKAYIDTVPTELFQANFCFRAVPIPKGTHTVRMEYAPWIHKPFFVISWGIIGGTLLAWGIVVVRKRRPPQEK